MWPINKWRVWFIVREWSHLTHHRDNPPTSWLPGRPPPSQRSPSPGPDQSLDQSGPIPHDRRAHSYHDSPWSWKVRTQLVSRLWLTVKTGPGSGSWVKIVQVPRLPLVEVVSLAVVVEARVVDVQVVAVLVAELAVLLRGGGKSDTTWYTRTRFKGYLKLYNLARGDFFGSFKCKWKGWSNF